MTWLPAADPAVCQFMKHATQRIWGGRFAGEPAEAVRQFTESVSFDWRLYRQDIAGSIAHARGLARIGVLTKAEANQIIRGLRAIEKKIEAGKFAWDPALEDVHMNIEAALGPAGRKLHTARSRNDQVATDLRLWVRDARIQTVRACRELMRALVALAEKYREVVIPGYTHLQRAQPVLLAHHLLAYVEMLHRDVQRFIINADLECPLGSGALAGSTLPLDREFVARQLQLAAPTRNSMDAVANRDFVLSYLFAAAVCGMHLSRLAEDFRQPQSFFSYRVRPWTVSPTGGGLRTERSPRRWRCSGRGFPEASESERSGTCPAVRAASRRIPFRKTAMCSARSAPTRGSDRSRRRSVGSDLCR